MRLQGQIAIVTGSTQGIGEAIARRYAKEGAKVAIVSSRSLERAHAIVSEIRSGGGVAEAFLADCSKVPEIGKLVDDVIAAFGGLDIIVNNAGIMHTASVEQTTEAIWDEQLDLNLKGAFFLVRAALPEFRRAVAEAKSSTSPRSGASARARIVRRIARPRAGSKI